MSCVTRRKHVLKEMLEDDFELPKENQQIVRVVCNRGNNLHEVETADTQAEHFLVSMPNKFRKNVWVKRGDFLLVDPIVEGDKVKAEICKILTPQHVKEYTKAGVWPQQFTKTQLHGGDEVKGGDDLMMPNLNRPVSPVTESDDSDDDDADDKSTSSDEN